MRIFSVHMKRFHKAKMALAIVLSVAILSCFSVSIFAIDDIVTGDTINFEEDEPEPSEVTEDAVKFTLEGDGETDISGLQAMTEALLSFEEEEPVPSEVTSDAVTFTLSGDGTTYSSGFKDTIEETLNSSLEPMSGKDISDIGTLTITAGTLTDVDVMWITNNLTGLENLEISGQADFESETLPAYAFSCSEEENRRMQNLREVSINVADEIKFGDYAFYCCRNLSEINLPNTTTFGDYAFNYCDDLRSVSLPNAITFGDYAFYSCYGLSSVSLPRAKTFGDCAFHYCYGLSSVSLPRAKTFGDCAFIFCDGLSSVSLPNTTTFGDYAFYYCDGLSSVSLPRATSFGEGAFELCDESISLDLGEIPPSVSDGFAKYLPDGEGVPIVRVPIESVKKYEDISEEDEEGYWFKFKIEGVGEPLAKEGVSFSLSESDILYETGFNGSLAESLATKLAEIEGKAVSDITLLKISSGILNSEDVMWISQNLSRLEVLNISGEAGFESETLPDYAFSDRDEKNTQMGNLEKVTIEVDDEIKFGNYTFINCHSLSSVSLPNATTFGEYAFGGCINLSSVSLPNATLFGEYAFRRCSTLSEVSLPVVSNIGTKCFRECNKQITMYLGKIPPTVSDGFVLYAPDEEGVAKVRVPIESVKKYEDISEEDEEGYWFKFKIEGVGEPLAKEGVSFSLSESDMLYETGFNGSLAESLESRLAEIEGKAVSDITLLKISSGILNSEDVMWITNNLTGLENLEISGQADFELTEDKFPEGAFSHKGSDCNLKEVKIDINDDKELIFGEGSFDNQFKLEKISLPEAVTFGDDSFESCRSLKMINLPKVRIFSGTVFLGCEQLEEINLPEAMTLGTGTFAGCTNLREVKLPSASKFEDYLFVGCSNLTELHLPKISEIGSNMFGEVEEYSVLTKPIILNLGENPPSVADGFNGYKPSEGLIPKLIVPKGSESKYEGASDKDEPGYWYKFKIEYKESGNDSDDSDGDTGDSGGSSHDNRDNADKKESIAIEVNGDKKDNLAQAKKETKNGHEVTIISLDEKKLENKLEQAEKGVKFSLAVEEDKGKIVGEFNGQMIKDMEFKEAVLDIKTSIAEYILPAEEIHIERVSEQFGKKVDLEDIKIHMEIGEPEEDMVKVVEDTANEGHFTMIVPPVDFTVTCTDGDKVVEVKEFKDYVERIIAIPEGEDPKKITTGLIIYPDGTTCHVPTKVIEKEGRYYAKINSLTNSTYSLIWNPKEYEDVKGHWAEEVCNEMGARKIVAETNENTFSPDANVSRGMFAQTVVRALGLGVKGENQRFHDIETSEYYFGDIATALEFDLVSGYEDKTFRAQKDVTREEAAAFMVRAMKIAGLKVDFTKADLEAELEKFIDERQISDWAREVVAICVKNGMLAGNEALELSPKESMTKAQLASMVDRMLRSAELI